MKKEQQKSTAKKAYAAQKKSIKESLIKELKSFAASVGHTSKKIEKEIEKSAKHLAKKLAKPAKTELAAPKVKADSKSSTVAKVPQLVTAHKKPAAPAAAPRPAKEQPAKKAAPGKKTGK